MVPEKCKQGGESQDKLTKEEMKILNDVMNNNIEEITNQENKQKVNVSIIEAIFSENMAYISVQLKLKISITPKEMKILIK